MARDNLLSGACMFCYPCFRPEGHEDGRGKNQGRARRLQPPDGLAQENGGEPHCGDRFKGGQHGGVHGPGQFHAQKIGINGKGRGKDGNGKDVEPGHAGAGDEKPGLEIIDQIETPGGGDDHQAGGKGVVPAHDPAAGDVVKGINHCRADSQKDPGPVSPRIQADDQDGPGNGQDQGQDFISCKGFLQEKKGQAGHHDRV